MLKCEYRTSLHAVHYKRQLGSVLMFCVLIILGIANLDTLFFCSMGQQACLCS